MEYALRWRLDLIIGLLLFIALCAATLLVRTGLFGVLVVVAFVALVWIAFPQIGSYLRKVSGPNQSDSS